MSKGNTKIYSTDIADFFGSTIDFSEFDLDALTFLLCSLNLKHESMYIHSEFMFICFVVLKMAFSQNTKVILL